MNCHNYMGLYNSEYMVLNGVKQFSKGQVILRQASLKTEFSCSAIQVGIIFKQQSSSSM